MPALPSIAVEPYNKPSPTSVYYITRKLSLNHHLAMTEAHPDSLDWDPSIDNDPLDWNAPQLIPRAPRNLISQAEWTRDTRLLAAAGSQPPGWQFDVWEDPVPPRPPLHVRFNIVNHPDLVEPRIPWERRRPPSPVVLAGSTDAQEILQLADIASHHTRGRVIITSQDHGSTPRVVIPRGQNSRRSSSEPVRPVSRGNELYLSDPTIARDAQASALVQLLNNSTEYFDAAEDLLTDQPVGARPAETSSPRSCSR